MLKSMVCLNKGNAMVFLCITYRDIIPLLQANFRTDITKETKIAVSRIFQSGIGNIHTQVGFSSVNHCHSISI